MTKKISCTTISSSEPFKMGQQMTKKKTQNESPARRGQLVVIEGSKQLKRKGTSRSATLPNGLTEKQETFCMAVFEGSGFSDAYRAAYDAQNMKPATINRQAHELMVNPKITARMDQLHRQREQEQRMSALSRSEKVIKKLEEIGLQDDSGGTAQIRALELLGKTIGMFTDKIETEDKTERDADAIKAELQRKLQSMLQG